MRFHGNRRNSISDINLQFHGNFPWTLCISMELHGIPWGYFTRGCMRANSHLRDRTEAAMHVSNKVITLVWQFSEYSWVPALFLDWIIGSTLRVLQRVDLQPRKTAGAHAGCNLSQSRKYLSVPWMDGNGNEIDIAHFPKFKNALQFNSGVRSDMSL